MKGELDVVVVCIRRAFVPSRTLEWRCCGQARFNDTGVDEASIEHNNRASGPAFPTAERKVEMLEE